MLQSLLRPGLAILLSLLLPVVACKKDDTAAELAQMKKEAVAQYAAIVLASYEDSYQKAQTLRQTIDDFVAAPTEAGFTACKNAWLAARNPYGQTEAYRFYGGPIDNETGPEGLINSWPLDEVYIDYVLGNSNGGIINKTAEFPILDKALIESLNQTGGDTEEQSEVNVATGYHAIEFLLWGQDASSSGPGQRAYTDYTIAPNAVRRSQYLKICAELLSDHLQTLVDAWQPGAAYREALLNGDPNEAINKIFTGLGSLSKGELAGERMFVAVDSQDQENEHSCFSDNTNADILMNFKGIQNVYNGTYTRSNGTKISGRSFAEVAAKVNSTKNNAVVAALSDAEGKLALIPAPFDQAILNSQGLILGASESLKNLSDRLADIQFDLVR